MATFYKVKDELGRVYTGVSEKEDVRALKKTLHDRGWYVIKVAPFKERKESFFQKKVGLEDLIMFTHQLCSMLEVGIPILRALDILWKQVSNVRLQVVISRIKDRLAEGKSLYEAFGEFPDVFPLIYRSLLGVAQTGAGLVTVLSKLVEYLNNQRVFISKIKRATTYPLVVIAFAILVVILMLVWVVPTFQVVFGRINVELPLITQIILNISALMRSVLFWVIIGIFSILATFFYKKIAVTSYGRYKIDSLKLKLPILGNLLYTASLARFIRSLGLLLSAGLPIGRSLETAKAVVINKKITRSLDSVEKRITEGVSLSDSLAETRIFPSLLSQMVAVGEESGTLSEMLDKVSAHFEEELDYRLNKFLTLIEPLLIIFVGGIVVFVLMSIYLPVFKLWGGIVGMR